MRVGFGYDVHRLVTGRPLILGGVHVPFHKGLRGHSDADVLIHSVIDALLGAAALGDIGTLFPDNDIAYKDIDSRILLRKTLELIQSSGYKVSNIDTTICAQAPRLLAFVSEMRANLAEDLQVELSAVSVKATTEEGLGFTGSGDGISADCIALLI
ncbi:MAG: 2-C-methyl-D-erythritol 2,4-cyclodiphosphate synthase [Candidatus Cloacimonetes bacterium]|nr:2-C-methyl-D-erythritol 2,4-cyclodiphosphate synthase [Candidatus Cloacimonadota bacterium]